MGFSFFKRPRADDMVAAGAVYRRVVAGNVVETARVLAVTADRSQIPHVRFVARNSLSEGTTADELRTLSLEAFIRLFGDRQG